MNSLIVMACVAFGLGVVVTRRRSVALVLVTAQSFTLAGVALWHAIGHANLAVAAAGLMLRAIAIAVILGIAIARTRESRPVRAGIEPMTRAVIALVSLLAIPPLVPSLGLADPGIQQAAVSLGVLGIVIALVRRATIVQVLGIVVAENGSTLLALFATDTVPGVIELGVIFDLLLITVVATAFHQRIFGHFGSGDTAHLRGLHD